MHRRAPIHHHQQTRVVQRSVMLLLMNEISTLLSRRSIDRELTLNFFHTLSLDNPLVYALLLQQNPNCYYDLSRLEWLRDAELLSLLTSLNQTLYRYTATPSNTFVVDYRGTLGFMDINDYYLNSWGRVVPSLFQDVVAPQPLFSRPLQPHQSQIHRHSPAGMMAPLSSHTYGHYRMFAQGPTTGVSRPGSSHYDMSGSSGPSGAHFHNHNHSHR